MALEQDSLGAPPPSPARRSLIPPEFRSRCTILALTVLAYCSSPVCPQGYPPSDAASKMQIADGLLVNLFASEPEVRQPILVKCDDRGRLWTIQYLQYPNPAGLQRVKVDRWSRTIYDRIPEPPPHGPKGADRITILEDTDRDGRAEHFQDFVRDLNLVTGLEFGHGGVFVLNVPYLLFYPDRDRDDVPDSDPEVLLSGFGMEDAQSLANHLTWGPDGWLYGVNGSTTTCNIRGIEFQQGCWRYHPITTEFELFCEGGSNTYGLTFDAEGELFYSTNGGPFVHAVQGGYYYKSFGKHGPLHNPYAYHFFGPLVVDQVPGGPPTGGTIYLADMLPPVFRGKFLAGNFLGHTISWWDVAPVGTSVQATYGGVLLDAKDTWFGPTDLCVGPGGELYVSDFCDARTAHPDPDANWDRSNGRIYRITAKTQSTNALPEDLARLSSDQLVHRLTSPHQWIADRTRCELAFRRDSSVASRLREMALDPANVDMALEGLWGLHAVGGFDSAIAQRLLDSPWPPVRSWTVRLLGDRRHVDSAIAKKLAHLASNETNERVRLQLAASAKRLPAEDALPIVEALLSCPKDPEDERTRWMLWWAVEDKAVAERDRVMRSFTTANLRGSSYRGIAVLLARRYSAEGSAAGYDCAARLIDAVAAHCDEAARREILASVAKGLAERKKPFGPVEQGGLFEEQAPVSGAIAGGSPEPAEPIGGPLSERIRTAWSENPTDRVSLDLAILAGIQEAWAAVKRSLTSAETPDDHKQALLETVRDFAGPEMAPIALDLVLAPTTSDSVRLSALDALARIADDESVLELLKRYALFSHAARPRVRRLALSRPAGAGYLLASVDDGRIDPKEIAVDELRVVALHNDPKLDALVSKHWGRVGPGTPEEMLATMRRFQNDLRAGHGDAARGKELFAKHCGTCHVLFGEGSNIGPDLTTANRGDRAALLANIVDPSAVVRREYLPFVIETAAGQILSGLIVEQDAASLTLLDAKNNRTRLDRSEIEAIREATTSLMPERLLDELSPQQLRDLFAYLEGAAGS